MLLVILPWTKNSSAASGWNLKFVQNDEDIWNDAMGQETNNDIPQVGDEIEMYWQAVE